MVKLVVLYTRPTDTAEFDAHFQNVHLPLLRTYPGLRSLEVTAVDGAPLGEVRYYKMVELYFDDRNAVDHALASHEGKAVARDLMGFAAPLVTVFFGNVHS